MWWLVGCSPGVPDAVSPDTAVVEVTSALDHALERIRARDPDAAASVYAAYHTFEQSLEPGLRARLPAAEVLSLEYAFGQVADAASDPTRAEGAVAALKQRIQVLAPPTSGP